MTTIEQTPKNVMKYIFQNKSYATLRACYLDNKDQVVVSLAAVHARLKRGWPLEDALLLVKQKTLITKLGAHRVEGTTYENLPAIALEYGLSLNTVYKRYSRGCRGDDLVPAKKKKSYTPPISTTSFRFHAGGVGYHSAADACAKLNVKYVTYRMKLSKGYSIEQALGIEPTPDGRSLRGKQIEIQGKYYTVKALAEHFNISESTVRDRLQRGATVEQAVGLVAIPKGAIQSARALERKRRQPIQLVVDGKCYASYKSLANAYALPAHVVRQRIVDYGYTAEAAVKAAGKSQPLLVDGKKYPSKAALAQAYNISPAVLLSRLANGFTMEQALGITSKPTSRTISFQGVTYNSLVDLAENNNISVAALRSRLQSGLTLQEAIHAGQRIINSGRYNLTILQRDSNLANKDASLYFVEMMLNGKARFKIGITTQTVALRLRQEAHDYHQLKVVKGTLLDCFNLEQSIIELLHDKRDPEVTSDMLDGYSEIFDLSEEEVLLVTEILDS
jgi:hypothetical protein